LRRGWGEVEPGEQLPGVTPMSQTVEGDLWLERMAEEPDASPYPDVDAKFRFMRPQLQDRDEYNFRHFRTKHLAYDVRATVEKRGITAGEPAPDFQLPTADGATFRLSEHRGRPVLLHFGSFT
jgi:hypothetical protein